MRNPQHEAAPGDSGRGGLRTSGGTGPDRPAPSDGRRFWVEIAVVLAVLTLFSLAVRMLDLDLRIARRFYRPGQMPAWIGIGSAFWDAVYRFGPWPANIVGGASLIGFLASFFRAGLRRHRRSLLLLATVLAIGPGLVVNLALKDHWGRPRPRDCVEFGGARSFLPVGTPGGAQAGRGFPSGHASSGFYFLALYILWRGRRPKAAALGLLAGLGMGTILSMQRMLVGAHFLSDCVWSAGIVVLTTLAADRVYRAKFESDQNPKAIWAKSS